MVPLRVRIVCIYGAYMYLYCVYIYCSVAQPPSLGMVMVFPPFKVVDSFFLSLPPVACGGGVHVYMIDMLFIYVCVFIYIYIKMIYIYIYVYTKNMICIYIYICINK